MPEQTSKSMDDIMALCKRRGFVYQASEIYGGINGFWDYGPLGAQLKKNLRDAWWRDVVMHPCAGKRGPDGEPVRIVPLDTCIIQNPKVWEASGHVAGFNDPMVDDKETKDRFRADHLQGLFAQPGNENATLQQVYSQASIAHPSRNIMPRATVIASNPSEAIELLQGDKKLQKMFGIRDFADPMAIDESDFWTANVDFGLGPIRCSIRAVEIDALRDNHDLIPSPFTGKMGVLTSPRQFNLMFFSYTGAVFNEESKVYLRPETAQGIFINFKNVVDTTRVRVPFGVAQAGKAFRNEVTPRNFTFRSREFEQMEIEFFCHPDEARDWYTFWRDWRMAWWESIGLKGDNLVLREHDKDELAHYAKEGAGTSDIEYRFPFTSPGYGELEGVAHRTDFDLRQHEEHSGVKLGYFDQERNERYLPHVIEPSAGLDRGVLALLCEAYTPDPDRPSKVYMKFHPRMAPIKAGVFPLVKKDGMPEKAEGLRNELAKNFGHSGFIEFDEKQSIGKRYARMDEAGCPFCFTIDGDTMADNTVTVRDRDTASQERIGIDKVVEFLRDRIG